MSVATSRPVSSSVSELIAGASSREPLHSVDSGSGAVLERVVIDGEAYVLKQVDVSGDWLLRATGDAGCRSVACWELGLYDSTPASIDHTVVGAARDPGRHGAGWLLMRDVSPWLVPSGSASIDLPQHRGFLDHMALLHASTWEWRDPFGLLPMSTRCQMLGPAMSELELRRGGTHPVPHAVPIGWRALDEARPELAAAARRLVAEPWPLVEALAQTPSAFLHGDWKLGNLGTAPDGRTFLLDWDRVGAGPATYDLAWYLAVNCDRLPESKEATIAAYRLSLEGHGVDTAPWWDRQLALSLLCAYLNLGWSKAVGDPSELAWWDAPCRRALGLLEA